MSSRDVKQEPVPQESDNLPERKPEPELEPRGYFTSDRSKSGGRYASPDLASVPGLELREPEAATNRQDILLAASRACRHLSTYY